MSISQKSAKKGPIKKALGWLFEPTLPKYEDEPTRAQKRKSTTPVKSGASSAKAKKIAASKAAKAAKKKKVPLSELSFEEQGDRLGYIDKHGAVRMKADGRQVGEISENDERDVEDILASYVEKFRKLEVETAELESNAENMHQGDLANVLALEETVKDSAGLGDPTAMLQSIANVKDKIESNTAKLKSDKLKVLQRADKLPMILDSGEVDWRGSDAALADITEAWRATGEVGAEAQEVLDLKYEKTLEAYSSRKEKFFKDAEGNARAKEKLVRRAQSLSQLKDAEAATAEFDALQRQWLSIGPADAENDALLRAKLNRARKDFESQNAADLEAIENRKAQLKEQKSKMADSVRALSEIKSARALEDGVRRQRDLLGQIESTLGQDGETKVADLQLTKEAERAQRLRKEQDLRVKQSTAEAEKIHARLATLADADKNGISWKDADQEMKDLREQVTDLNGLNRETREGLDVAFNDARRDFNANRTAFFEKMDEDRQTNGARKRALINDLPFYKNGASAAELVAHLNGSMEAWKKIGPAEREENEALWEEYRAVRSSLFEKVDELRELEKDDFVARLAYSFEKKKEELYRLESEVNREAMLADDTTDKEKKQKLKGLVDRKKLRIKGMQKEILDIQRKLSKMSKPAAIPATEEAASEREEAAA